MPSFLNASPSCFANHWAGLTSSAQSFRSGCCTNSRCPSPWSGRGRSNTPIGRLLYRWLDFGDMRLFALLLCLLMNVSFLLAPFSHVHAHLGHDDDSALVHGGHSHDFDAHDSADHHADDSLDHHAEHVIDLDSERAGQVASGLTWSPWLPLLYMVGLFFSMAPSWAVLLPRPPRSRPVLKSQHPPWPPPLRGPPISI